MNKYVFLCVLLFNTILLCHTYPSDNSEASHIEAIHTDIDKEISSVLHKRQVNNGEECDIIFPENRKGGFSSKHCHTTSYSAKGKGRNCIEGVCGDALDYPYEQMEKIKHKLAAYSNLFGHLDGTKILATRVGETEPTSLCTAKVHTIYPKTLKNDKDIEKFIVNVEGHKQGLLLETCNENATCLFASLFPNTYTSQCTQKYATRRLMALNEDGNPAFDSFVVPSCCLCMVKQLKN